MADTRRQIEAAASAAVRRDGLRGVSFRTLAEEVGVKSASVHYHFPTKDDLARSLVQSYSNAFLDFLGTIERTNKELGGKFDALVDGFEKSLAGEEFCLCGMLAAEVTSVDTSTRVSLRAFFDDVESWVSRTLTAHGADWQHALPAGALAAVIVSGLEGALLIDRLDARNTHLAAWRGFLKSLLC